MPGNSRSNANEPLECRLMPMQEDTQRNRQNSVDGELCRGHCNHEVSLRALLEAGHSRRGERAHQVRQVRRNLRLRTVQENQYGARTMRFLRY